MVATVLVDRQFTCLHRITKQNGLVHLVTPLFWPHFSDPTWYEIYGIILSRTDMVFSNCRNLIVYFHWNWKFKEFSPSDYFCNLQPRSWIIQLFQSYDRWALWNSNHDRDDILYSRIFLVQFYHIWPDDYTLHTQIN